MRLKELVEDFNVLRPAIQYIVKRAPVRRRPLFICVAFLLYFVTPAYKTTHALIEHFRVHEVAVHLRLSWARMAYIALSNAGMLWFWLLVTGACSYGFCIALTNYIRSVLTIKGDKSHSLMLVEQLQDRMGIVEIFTPTRRDAIGLQNYAPVMTSAVGMSKRVRLLSIAAYEYIGRGSDSLLYNTINRHTDADVYVILLNPQTGRKAIDQRVIELRDRDATITADSIIDNINKTVECLKGLRASRPPRHRFEIRLCKWHPIFRVLLCEDVMFYSSYGRALHGHESPIIQISRTALNGSADDTQYVAWDRYFDSIWDNSETVA